MVFEKDQKLVSVLQDDGFYGGRVLARKPSLSQSSRIFYRDSEGVPFIWEKQPGTPINPHEEEDIPPLSPPPLMQNMGLSLPNIDHDEPEGSFLKTSKTWNLKKMVKKGMKSDIIKKVEMLSKKISHKQQESSRFGDSDGDFVGSIKDSSFSSYSSSLSFSSNHRIMDSSRLPSDSNNGPFCCSPWSFSAILDEGNPKIYYCRQHKTAFAVEEDGSFLSRILSGVYTTEHFSGPLHSGTVPAGIPFDWEMQPGTPKNPPEKEHIPPPSPPPAVQSSTMPMPKLHVNEENAKAKESTWPRTWFWTRKNSKKKETENMKNEISFRYDENKKICSSDDSVSPLPKGEWRASKIKRNWKSSCGPWSRKEIFVFAKRKLKLFTS
ncbi:hypothetical protein ACJIZ3_025636 [Penstemon smallii]|uniref:Uncharacterized protein n=1 Tax=Penstemon smallii TaxID=265156 RepID=A0ABD3TXR7_9LAMI